MLLLRLQTLEIILSNGYLVNSNEQMGSIYSVSKGGMTEYITFSVNSFYAKWIWK